MFSRRGNGIEQNIDGSDGHVCNLRRLLKCRDPDIRRNAAVCMQRRLSLSQNQLKDDLYTSHITCAPITNDNLQHGATPFKAVRKTGDITRSRVV